MKKTIRPDLTVIPKIGAPKRKGYVFKNDKPGPNKDAWSWSAHAANGKCTASNHGFDTKAKALTGLMREIAGLTKVFYARPPR